MSHLDRIPWPNTDSSSASASVATSEGGDEAAARRIDELEDQLRRTTADLDNLRKRQDRELARQRSTERNRVTASWLPVVDNLELALKYASSDPDGIVTGVRAVRDQALAVLTDLGYTRHAEARVTFDPTRHEVVRVVEDPEAAAGTVVEVLRPGYGDGDQLLRPAAVSVAGVPA